MSRARALSRIPEKVVFLEDYYRSTDGGTMQVAFARALATGAKRINMGKDEYLFSDTVPINRSNVSIAGPGEALGTISITGGVGPLFDIGNAATAIFHVYLEGLTVSRTATAAASSIARVRNASYFAMKDSRFYMDHKFGSALDIQYGSYHSYRDIRFEDPIDHAVKISGGNAGPGGTVGGMVVGHRWHDCIFDGANEGKANPIDQASFIMEDNVQALWMVDCEGYRHLGPLVDMRGTFANRDNNVLNLFRNLNVEATYENSGTIRVGHYSNTAITEGWMSAYGSDGDPGPTLGGNGMPAIVLLEGSRDNRVTGLQIGAKNADAIADAGQSNRFENVEFIGYDDAEAAVRWLTGSTGGSMKGGEAKQFVNIAVNEAGTEAGHRISMIDSSAISGAPFEDFDGGKNSVTMPMNSDATPYYTRPGTALDLPWGLADKAIQITGPTGNIDAFRTGMFFGEIVRILPANGMVIRDTDLSGGNIVLGTSGATIAATGRGIYAFQWDGAAWRGQAGA